jgi:hypothetical protein
MIAVVFMFLAAVNFSLHFLAFRRRSVRGYWQDSEFRFYVLLLSIVISITVLGLYLTETYDDWQEALINGLFQAVSIGTTAGFTTAEFYNWPASSRSCCCFPVSSVAAPARPAAASRSSVYCCWSSRAARDHPLGAPERENPGAIGDKTSTRAWSRRCGAFSPFTSRASR